MTTFDDRKDAQEKSFAYSEQKSFEVEAKGSKIFGLWVAEKLGFEGSEAESYAKDVVAANLDEPGFDDILRKVKPDLDAKGIEISDRILNEEINKAMMEAERIIMEENAA